jgi:hypothetical protein
VGVAPVLLELLHVAGWCWLVCGQGESPRMGSVTATTVIEE